jgi:hypothetical protein
MNRPVLWKTSEPLVFDKPFGSMWVPEIPFSRLIFPWKKGDSLENVAPLGFLSMIDSNHSFPASSPPRRQTRAGKGDGVTDGAAPWPLLEGKLCSPPPPHLHVLNSSASSPSRLLAVRGWAAGLCCEPPEPTASAADRSRVDQTNSCCCCSRSNLLHRRPEDRGTFACCCSRPASSTD